MTRVALLTEIPAPYRIPLFNALSARVDLQVLFLRERNPDRPYDLHPDELHFAWSVLRGAEVSTRGRWLVFNRGVTHVLRSSQAVIVGGWNQPAFWTALGWCRRRHVPSILWSESTTPDRRSGRHDWLKRALLGIPAAFVVPGCAAGDYLQALGVAPGRIALAPNAVDSTIFGMAERTRANGPVRLLAVGRLAPEKGLETLLDAARDLPVEVILAGTGPEEGRLRRMAGSNVTFLGHVERDALPALYANADVLVMPSRSEPWGMALNEAALAGLPLVSTTSAGAAWDIIDHGVNGFRIRPDDVAALREALCRLVDDPGFRTAAGARSREIAARFTPEGWADAVATVVERATGERG